MKLGSMEAQAYELEKLEELRGTLNMISNLMVLPLYFLFWIADILYVPDLKWEFLGLRATVVPACLIVQLLIGKVVTYRQGQWLAWFFIAILAGIINAMIFIIADPATIYYAGLNLVAIGCLTFIPWTRSFFAMAIMAIFGPYFLYCATHLALQSPQAVTFTVHSFFIVGTVVISFVIRMFHEKLRIAEFKSRLKLNDEIGNRDSIIIQKTDEGMRLANLSAQFSPQVVEAIRNKQIDLKASVHRSQICAIFIDIVNSTERVARVDKDKVHNTISTFMDDAIRILLKYDITIDKFLGDGILAFSNDPLRQSDFVARVLYAATEIRKRTQDRRDYYEDNWLSPLELKIGITVGYANVGFYGHEKYFKSYTAIGPVINLANRLCSAAEANKIVVSSDVMDHLDSSLLKITPLGKLKLKGFEADVIKAFEVELVQGIPKFANDASEECPKCNKGFMQLATDDAGIYVLRCRSCGYVAGTDSKRAAA